MGLLVLDRVTKRYGDRTALDAASLVVDAGELLAVWGRRRSGRTTLLAVAAGIEAPTEGVVRFDGNDVASHPALGAPGGIGYCPTGFPAAVGGTVLDQVAMPLLGRGCSFSTARNCAEDALRTVGAADVMREAVSELGHADATRVVLARALVSEPRLLLIDQPTAGVSIATERDALLDLMRGVADQGIAVVMTVDEGAELAGADRALTIDAGELRGETTSGPGGDVIPLRQANGS